MAWKRWLLVLTAIGLSSAPSARATARTGATLRVQSVRSFYSSLVDEISHAGYNDAEQSLLAHPTDYYGRYLDPHSREYVTLAVMPRIADAIGFFDIESNPGMRIFDLGCGLGMQSLIFASLGATVVGVDVREESIQLCRKRQAYYERELGRKLAVEFHQADFARAELGMFGPRFDALFSMSAFSYIKPLGATVHRAARLLRDDARIFLYEQNAGFALDRWKRTEDIPTPEQVVSEFEREGFRAEFLRGAGSIPSGAWRVSALNESILQPANDVLRKRLNLSFKYTLGMKRGA